MSFHRELLHLTVSDTFLKCRRILMGKAVVHEIPTRFFWDTACLNHYFPSAALWYLWFLVLFFWGGQDAKIIMQHKYSRGEADLRVMLREKVHLIQTAILPQSKGAANSLCDRQPKVDTSRQLHEQWCQISSVLQCIFPYIQYWESFFLFRIVDTS